MNPQEITQNRAKEVGMIERHVNRWLGEEDSNPH